MLPADQHTAVDIYIYIFAMQGEASCAVCVWSDRLCVLSARL